MDKIVSAPFAEPPIVLRANVGRVRLSAGPDRRQLGADGGENFRHPYKDRPATCPQDLGHA